MSDYYAEAEALFADAKRASQDRDSDNEWADRLAVWAQVCATLAVADAIKATIPDPNDEQEASA